MAKQGTIPTTSDLPYYERLNGWMSGGGLGPNTITNYANLDSFAMPFRGSVACEIQWTFHWAGRQQLVLEYYPSTPAVSSGGVFSVIDGGNECYVVGYVNMRWADVAQGAVVAPGVGVHIGGAAPAVYLDQISINVRAYAL